MWILFKTFTLYKNLSLELPHLCVQSFHLIFDFLNCQLTCLFTPHMVQYIFDINFISIWLSNLIIFYKLSMSFGEIMINLLDFKFFHVH
jgi:hypothetical protein